MPTVTVLNAERMLEIEAQSIVGAQVSDNRLILTRHDGTQFDAGPVATVPESNIGAPIVTTHYGTDWNLNGAAAQWNDIPGGTVSNHPMDLVIPDCNVGDWVRADANFIVPALAGGVAVYFDFWTVVDGVHKNRFGGSPTTPQSTWVALAGIQLTNQGTRSYQLTADDIDADGNARLRLRYWRSTGTTTRTIAATYDIEVRFEGHGPFA